MTRESLRTPDFDLVFCVSRQKLASWLEQTSRNLLSPCWSSELLTTFSLQLELLWRPHAQVICYASRLRQNKTGQGWIIGNKAKRVAV